MQKNEHRKKRLPETGRILVFSFGVSVGDGLRCDPLADAWRTGESRSRDPLPAAVQRRRLLLFLICLATTPKSLFALSGRDYLKVALLSQFSFVGMSVFLFWGQRYTTAINSSMIMSSAPVLTILLGLFIGEKISLRQGIGMALGTLGCMMVIGVIAEHGFAYSPASFRGDLLVLVSALSWSIAAVYAKKVVTPGNDLAVTTWSSCLLRLSPGHQLFPARGNHPASIGSSLEPDDLPCSFPDGARFLRMERGFGTCQPEPCDDHAVSDSDHDNPHGMEPAR